MNDNKCFTLLYIYHLVQGIMLWISQNPLWASLQSPNIQQTKHRIMSTSEDLRNLTDIPSHSGSCLFVGCCSSPQTGHTIPTN